MIPFRRAIIMAGFVTLAFCAPAIADAPVTPTAQNNFTMDQVLSYPFVSEIVAAQNADRIAWVRNLNGVRNVWFAEGPKFRAHQITHYTADDGQEITHLTFSPDGTNLVYVRGGDHDANWPAKGDLAPDPDSSADQPKVTIWAASLISHAPVKIAEGDHPAISSTGQLAFIKDHKVWTASLDGKAKPQALFFDRGDDKDLQFSPDGSRLAFVSDRDGSDHAFIGVYTLKEKTLTYLAPSTNRDRFPRWSPDGTRIAFARIAGKGGAPQPILQQTPTPFSLWVADARTGAGRKVWQSPNTLLGSYPETAGEVNLHWAAGNRLVFLADLDNWPHLYSLPLAGGAPVLLTPGAYMVEHVVQSRDKRFMIYDANTGNSAGDDDRRHIYKVPVDRAAPRDLTSGGSLQWSPVAASAGRVAFIAAGPKAPPAVAMVGMDASNPHTLNAAQVPEDFPESALVVPEQVTFTSPDGLTIHGQLFRKDGVTEKQPGIIFVHGGPPRQMLLGWHYMDYYANAYAVNQYLANHGFTVLSVNYRLGIGYGHAFHHPDHAGPTGAAEYQDVLAGARYLQKLPGVNADRIGIWGGSYGGYLTAMGLARNSDVFKAGVDLHGVHDWSAFLGVWFGKTTKRYEKGDREQAMKIAFDSSPIASMDTWKSPVLLIQGDDDRNVNFSQTIDLARRLDAHHIAYEELVIPNEIHGFLRHASWAKADAATAAYLTKQLLTPAP